MGYVLRELDEAVGDKRDADRGEDKGQRHPGSDDGRRTCAQQRDRTHRADQTYREGGRVDHLQFRMHR
jgi:hypothetical protein